MRAGASVRWDWASISECVGLQWVFDKVAKQSDKRGASDLPSFHSRYMHIPFSVERTVSFRALKLWMSLCVLYRACYWEDGGARSSGAVSVHVCSWEWRLHCNEWHSLGAPTKSASVSPIPSHFLAAQLLDREPQPRSFLRLDCTLSCAVMRQYGETNNLLQPIYSSSNMLLFNVATTTFVWVWLSILWRYLPLCWNRRTSSPHHMSSMMRWTFLWRWHLQYIMVTNEEKAFSL